MNGPKDVAELLRTHWALGRPVVSHLGGGMNSATWLVEDRGTRYVAKLVSPTALDELIAGCEAAECFAEAGFVTGRPVRTMDGALLAVDARMALLEHAPGRPLTGESAAEQTWIAETIAGVHAAGRPVTGHGTADFFDWLAPEPDNLTQPGWLTRAIAAVRTETDRLTATWSLLHTDPVPEAFLREDGARVCGLIDWAGARRGPVLYDIASVVMYLGGPDSAGTFLDHYCRLGPLDDGEIRHLDAFRRFRWAVQGAYFADRIARRDLTGVTDQRDNERGLAHARAGLAQLGIDVQ